MGSGALTKARIRAAELHFDGLSHEEIAKKLIEEGFKPRSRRMISLWFEMPKVKELLARLEKVAAEKCVNRRRKLQEVAFTKTAMFLDGVGNTVTIGGKTKIQEVKPEVTVQLLKALICAPTKEPPPDTTPPPKVESKELSEVEVRAWFAARNQPFPGDPVEDYDPTTAAPGNG